MFEFVLLFNLFIFLVYNIYTLIEYGIPESLSETTYLFGSKHNWLFTLLCFVVSFCLLPIWLSVDSNFEFLKFLSIAPLLFVGVTPYFKDGIQKPIHYTSAIISFISVLLWFLMNGLYNWLIGMSTIFIILELLFDNTKYVYYLEIVVWLSLIMYIMSLV